jgi:anaerobic selenocysteine-containing dehydrogenase
MATPGIDAVEAQGAPPRAGQASPVGEAPVLARPASNGAEAVPRPRLLAWPQPVEAPALPPADRYSLRLVSSRQLYDRGVLLDACPALAPLAPAAVLRANTHELDQLGVKNGERVRVRSARAALVLEAVAEDGLPRGVAAISFNLGAEEPGSGAPLDGERLPGAGALIDVGAPVTDVRVETLGAGQR